MGTRSPSPQRGPSLVAGGSTVSCFPEGSPLAFPHIPSTLSWRPEAQKEELHEGVPARRRGWGPGRGLCGTRTQGFSVGLSGQLGEAPPSSLLTHWAWSRWVSHHP